MMGFSKLLIDEDNFLQLGFYLEYYIFFSYILELESLSFILL